MTLAFSLSDFLLVNTAYLKKIISQINIFPPELEQSIFPNDNYNLIYGI
jgi:hypothetical protein